MEEFPVDDLEDELPEFPAELLSADGVRVSWVRVEGEFWGRGVLEGSREYISRVERAHSVEWGSAAGDFDAPRIVRIPDSLSRVRWTASLQSWEKLSDDDDHSLLDVRWYADEAQHDVYVMLAEILKTIDWRHSARGFSLD